MVDKQTIRPIYSELQGYLTQRPSWETTRYIEVELSNQYNAAVQELKKLTDEDYDRFTLQPKSDDARNLVISQYLYRQKLAGLIARLHGTYFPDEPAPFASMPSTIINQSQNQSVEIQLQQEVKNLIELKLSKAEGKEKTFWENIKGGLSVVKNISQLVSLIITTAKAAGIPIDQLASLFS